MCTWCAWMPSCAHCSGAARQPRERHLMKIQNLLLKHLRHPAAPCANVRSFPGAAGNDEHQAAGRTAALQSHKSGLLIFCSQNRYRAQVLVRNSQRQAGEAARTGQCQTGYQYLLGTKELHFCCAQMRGEVMAQLEAAEAANREDGAPPPGSFYVSASWLACASTLSTLVLIACSAAGTCMTPHTGVLRAVT